MVPVPHALPINAEFVAISGFVLLSAFLTVELLRGPQSPARRALAAFTGFVIGPARGEIARRGAFSGSVALPGSQRSAEDAPANPHVLVSELAGNQI